MLQRILSEANLAFETGDYANAAERYTRLAERAVIRGNSRAGNWMIKAGQANVLAGRRDTGMQQIFKGLDLLRNEGRLKDFRRYAWRTVDLFNTHGLQGEAREVTDWMQGVSPEMTIPTNEPAAQGGQVSNHQKLPSKCPSCGAPVHPETVDWVENGQAACAYCGILLPES